METVDYRLNNAENRIEKHGIELDRLGDLLTRLTIIEEQNQRRIDEQEERIKALEATPAKRWDTAITCMMTALIGAVIGFIASKIGF